MSLPGSRAIAQPTELTDLSIAQAGRLIRSGDLSPVDLAGAYLGRIDRLDSRINAFITVAGERALTRARELETELINGTWRGPLHGIPIALKDNIDTADVRTTAGSGVHADRIPDENAAIVDRLEHAGAIVLGKLNMDEFAFGHSSAEFGRVRNPWDFNRVTGGSSSGSAAAVAARLCAGALGTDTGGSVRIPASLCGIVGLKATHGLASIRGIIPISASLDHVGPMCRTVADAALMLQAMAGYDPLDVASIAAQIPDYASALQRRTSGLRLGVPRAMFYDDLDPQILDAIDRALEVLRQLTSGMQDVALPPLPDAGPVISAEAFEYHAELIENKRELYDPVTLERILGGREIQAWNYVETREQLSLARNAIARVFNDVDLLITPTVDQLPITIEETIDPATDLILIRNTLPFNILGIPSITIPCGFSQEGLPIGLQISGPALTEVDILALAHAYEQATEWHERIPQLTQNFE